MRQLFRKEEVFFFWVNITTHEAWVIEGHKFEMRKLPLFQCIAHRIIEPVRKKTNLCLPFIYTC